MFLIDICELHPLGKHNYKVGEKLKGLKALNSIINEASNALTLG
jgi:hypothetical protein